MRTLIALTLAALLAGCATVPPAEAPHAPKRQAVHHTRATPTVTPIATPAMPAPPAAAPRWKLRLRWLH